MRTDSLFCNAMVEKNFILLAGSLVLILVGAGGLQGQVNPPRTLPVSSPAPKVGLSDVLQGEARLEHALLELQDAKLTILPAGALVLNPQELLRSQFVSALFADLRKQFDHVIVDTPPVVPFTDASVLGTLSDGVVLVVRANKTPRPLVERAVDAVANSKILGVVLNAVQITPVDRYYYKYDEYNPDRYSIREDDE